MFDYAYVCLQVASIHSLVGCKLQPTKHLAVWGRLRHNFAPHTRTLDDVEHAYETRRFDCWTWNISSTTSVAKRVDFLKAIYKNIKSPQWSSRNWHHEIWFHSTIDTYLRWQGKVAMKGLPIAQFGNASSQEPEHGHIAERLRFPSSESCLCTTLKTL